MPDRRANASKESDTNKESPQSPPDQRDEPSEPEPNGQGWENDVLRRARTVLESLTRRFRR